MEGVLRRLLVLLVVLLPFSEAFALFGEDVGIMKGNSQECTLLLEYEAVPAAGTGDNLKTKDEVDSMYAGLAFQALSSYADNAYEGVLCYMRVFSIFTFIQVMATVVILTNAIFGTIKYIRGGGSTAIPILAKLMLNPILGIGFLVVISDQAVSRAPMYELYRVGVNSSDAIMKDLLKPAMAKAGANAAMSLVSIGWLKLLGRAGQIGKQAIGMGGKNLAVNSEKIAQTTNEIADATKTLSTATKNGLDDAAGGMSTAEQVLAQAPSNATKAKGFADTVGDMVLGNFKKSFSEGWTNAKAKFGQLLTTSTVRMIDSVSRIGTMFILPLTMTYSVAMFMLNVSLAILFVFMPWLAVPISRGDTKELLRYLTRYISIVITGIVMPFVFLIAVYIGYIIPHDQVNSIINEAWGSMFNDVFTNTPTGETIEVAGEWIGKIGSIILNVVFILLVVFFGGIILMAAGIVMAVQLLRQVPKLILDTIK
ncbi:hypothetical protein [Deinococcus roseus]|uniref:Conjugal transfer protein TrbL n=1 Tax=Deinococcus roseus TaxID=392414 RepID=A0ABQ2D6X6_9DEIO|nr:hypothetical protein [Deinococcus roseus]GGJ48157.1 hypothetical protein GCM10008938_37740 [Deinococcus roseus]